MTAPLRALWFFPVLWTVAGRATAAPIERTVGMLVQEVSETEIGLGLPFPSTAGGTAARRYSGEFLCAVGFDSATLAVDTFTFQGGTIYASAYAISFDATVAYPAPYGQRYTFVTRQPTSVDLPPQYEGILRLRPETVPDTGAVGADGRLLNFQHRLHADAGRMVTARSVTGSPQPSVVDNYYDFPEDLPFPGTATVEVREVSGNRYERTVRVVLTIVFDERRPRTLPGSVPALKLDVVETETGSVLANSVAFKIATSYGRWAGDNGLVQPDPEARNAAGIPYGILFALDLPATSSTLPLHTGEREGGPVVILQLPEDGLLNPMLAEYSPDLSTGWSALDPACYLDGEASLDTGATGSPAFAFPGEGRGFIRFSTSVE